MRIVSAFRLTCLESTASTNEVVKQLIEAGEPAGAAVRAYEQTGGYGRQGRAWASPAGGMYQSLLLRPDMHARATDLSTVTLVAGLAARAALKEAAKYCEAQVKWPNDIVCTHGKLCGISSEAYRGALCIGIGINVFEPATAPDITGGNMPAYLVDFTPPFKHDRCVEEDGLSHIQRGFVDYVGDAVLDEFERRYDMWCREGFAAFIDEYRAHMAMRGAYVEVENRAGGLIAAGEVANADEDGCLLLSCDQGLVPVASGEAHIAKRAV